MGYSRCNPFGSDEVRFGAPCTVSRNEIAEQAAAQALQQEARLAALKPTKTTPLPTPVVVPIVVPDILPIQQHCGGILASSGSILASSACRLAGNSIPSAPPIPLLLASSGILRASSHLHVTG